MPNTDQTAKLPVVPLAAMSFAAFVYVTFEMFAIGLISPMARDLNVSEGQIGLLMSVYAGLVAVVTIPLMHVTRKVDRRYLLIATLVFLLGGIVLQATATSYATLVAGRVTAALTHGLFWSLVNPVAARIAPPGQMGKAVAAVSFGSTLSMVVGSPLTTAMGSAIGWRAATWVLGAAVVGALLMLVVSLPSLPARPPAQQTGAQATKSAIPSLVIYLVLAVMAIFVTFTYLALLVEATAGHRFVPYGVAVYGIAGLVGVTLSGRLVDARMIRLNGIATATLVASGIAGLLALHYGMGIGMFAVIVVFGIAAGALPTVATTIFLFAGQRNQDLVSSVYVVTFQVGIASGSALGAATVDLGYLGGTLLSTAVLGALAFTVMATRSRSLLR